MGESNTARRQWGLNVFYLRELYCESRKTRREHRRVRITESVKSPVADGPSKKDAESTPHTGAANGRRWIFPRNARRLGRAAFSRHYGFSMACMNRY
jgi:hypothetical protein